MAKSTSYNTLSNVRLTLSFNRTELDNGTLKYRPVTINGAADAVTPEGASIQVASTETVGALTSTPLSNVTLWFQLNATHAKLGAAFKSLAIAGINEDPSV